MPRSKPIPTDIRNQILERVKTSGLPIVQIAQEHGINVKNIYNWLHKQVDQTVDTREILRLQKENHELRSLVADLAIQVSREAKKGSSGRITTTRNI